jgi:putative ABC transport system permease protein
MSTDLLKKWRKLELQSGAWETFAKQDDAALVGSAVAGRRKLKAGDKFTIGDITVVVAGVFSADNAADEGLIYTHLDFLQRARGLSDVGMVTQIEVHLNDGANSDAVAQAIDAEFHSGLVATTTVMSVQDRIKEHAVLQTLGFRPRRIFGLVVTESVLLSLLGGGLGIVAGMIFLAWSGMSVAAEGVTIAFRPSWQIAFQGAVASLGVGVIAGLAPGWQAAQAKIVAALRHA